MSQLYVDKKRLLEYIQMLKARDLKEHVVSDRIFCKNDGYAQSSTASRFVRKMREYARARMAMVVRQILMMAMARAAPL